ncbi:hypothetical protein WJX72_007596 [[Myrmecia] bisecta]|uniref:Uncharacterized protein n=1 Tax=[Myrmecia] bisecta TaxID=41462 RepID=A0AAW1PTF3_9CHLO
MQLPFEEKPSRSGALCQASTLGTHTCSRACTFKRRDFPGEAGADQTPAPDHSAENTVSCQRQNRSASL